MQNDSSQMPDKHVMCADGMQGGCPFTHIGCEGSLGEKMLLEGVHNHPAVLEGVED